MIPQRADENLSAADESSQPSHHSRRRHRHRRSFYSIWIRPYRRELRTIILFCLAIIVAYLLWQTVTGG